MEIIQRISFAIIYSLLTISILSISACSNSGASIGYFTDSPVSGVSYTTASRSGITDASGAFYYEIGESITFSIGTTVLGEPVIAKSEMTPFDLVPDAVLYTNATQVRKVVRSGRLAPEHVAFNRFTNILVFLQSLDDDANPENGINIPASVAELFNGVHINFDDDLMHFSSNNILRNITHQAAEKGLLSTAAIKKPGYALDHFYNTQSISESFSARTSSSHDTDADGYLNSIYDFTYDNNGYSLTSSSDDDADGSIDSISTYSYDDNGNRLIYSADHGADGIANYIHTYTYDVNGNLLTDNVDEDADGIQNSISTYTYDVNGNLLTVTGDDADGNSNYTLTHTYDVNGNILTYSYDNDADGNLDSITSDIYDTDDNLITRNHDTDADGDPNSITTYTYDESGNLISVSDDSDADDDPNSIITYTYDENGNVITVSDDSDADGKPNLITTYSYDINDNLLMVNEDVGANGTLDSIDIYTYDTKGRRLTSRIDSDADGYPEKKFNYSYIYDINDNVISSSFDNDDDGKPDSINSYIFVKAKWTAVLTSVYSEIRIEQFLMSIAPQIPDESGGGGVSITIGVF